jgi:hypothetical protein
MAFPPSVEQWRQILQRVAGDLPIDFLLAWLAHESGGNPCAVGIPGVEAGIFQTYHPHDDQYGATFAQLRAACSGQSQHRQLDGEEAQLQAVSGANLVRAMRERARQMLARVGASWSESSPDFWKMVKLGHNLPAVQYELLPIVRAQLGRPPRGWDEFASRAQQIQASQMSSVLAGFKNSPSVRGRQDRIADVFANAEDVGKFGGGVISRIVKYAVPAALIAALGYAAYRIVNSGSSQEAS